MTSSASETDPILAAALDAVITIDGDGHVVELNPAAEEIFGYSRTEALGRPMAELLIPPELRAAQRAGMERALSGGPSRILGRRVELPAMRADGREFPAEVAVTRTAQTPPRFTAWIRDLTQRNAVEAESGRRKGLLKRAEQVAQIGSWEWTPETGEILWSDNLFRLFDLEPGELRPTLELLLERTHLDDRGRVERYLDSASREGELPPIHLRIVRPDGTLRHLRTTAGFERHEEGEPRRLLGAVHDVTDQRRAENEIAAHLAVSEALTLWDSLEQGGEQLLRALVVALDFAVGALWLPQGDVLAPRLFWSAPPSEYSEFEHATTELRLPKGVGLPGQAWEQGQLVSDASVIADDGFVRREAAARNGLRAGVAIPVLTGDEVLAVVELYSIDRAEISERLIRFLTGVAYELGTFIARRRAELKPPPLTPRQLEILQLAAEGLSGRAIAEQLGVSGATVKTHFEHIYERLAVRDRAAAVARGLRDGLIQ